MGDRPMHTGDAHLLLDALRDCGGPVLLTGPLGPDGDSLGACLALARVLGAAGVSCTVAGDASARYRPLPHFDAIVPDADVAPSGWAAVVVLDGDRHRLTPAPRAAFAAAPFTAIIDHHASTTPDGYTMAWLDAGASSACEMLCEAFEARQIPIDADIAALLYAGIAFDTGCFRYSNTTPSTLRRAAFLLEQGFDHARLLATMLVERRFEALQLAADVFEHTTIHVDGRLAIGRVPFAAHTRLGLVPGDVEGLVDSLVHIQGVDVACLIIDRPEGGVKLSLRSRGAVDVSRLANALAPSGGGHAKAAGVLLDGDRDTIADHVQRQLVAGLQGDERAFTAR